MRAVWLEEFRPPAAHVPGETPDPVAGARQVVVAGKGVGGEVGRQAGRAAIEARAASGKTLLEVS